MQPKPKLQFKIVYLKIQTSQQPQPLAYLSMPMKAQAWGGSKITSEVIVRHNEVMWRPCEWLCLHEALGGHKHCKAIVR